ncbi:MAG: flagellar assembly peptidoglycan hydrolase FlgJ [Burkholderiales bacterium]|nr:flagellar assembly peptidoglycan hydrolase FlgJ [Burkholderiales bacterium]MBH2017688.1 flagellar assembly peptidoglycan hydrolase FlgJ [Burkholderiales bacterium]
MSLDTPPSPSSASRGLTMDVRSLERLKATSGTDPRAAIRETAKQLESLFMNELMKSMRASTMSTGMLDNAGTDMGTSMLDTQLAGQMVGRSGGLGDVIARQLERQMGIKPKEVAQAPKDGDGMGLPSELMLRRFSGNSPAGPDATPRVDASGNKPVSNANGASRTSASERFIQKHHQAAKAAEAATGIPSGHILGQAALESGWGKHEIKMKDGTPSHNLFGIKATSSWTGKVAEVTTTEYIGGVARKVTAKFRAYDSYEDAFKDHARLLTNSPRYSQTAAQADTARGYAMGLQKGGYATDPAYADKLTQVINTALRVQRGLA